VQANRFLHLHRSLSVLKSQLSTIQGFPRKDVTPGRERDDPVGKSLSKHAGDG